MHLCSSNFSQQPDFLQLSQQATWKSLIERQQFNFHSGGLNQQLLQTFSSPILTAVLSHKVILEEMILGLDQRLEYRNCIFNTLSAMCLSSGFARLSVFSCFEHVAIWHRNKCTWPSCLSGKLNVSTTAKNHVAFLEKDHQNTIKVMNADQKIKGKDKIKPCLAHIVTILQVSILKHSFYSWNGNDFYSSHASCRKEWPADVHL